MSYELPDWVHDEAKEFDSFWQAPDGRIYLYTGILVASDGLYYMLSGWRGNKWATLSCVGSIESYGFSKVDRKGRYAPCGSNVK